MTQKSKAQFKVVAINPVTKEEKYTARGQFYAGDELVATDMETGYLPSRKLARIYCAARNRGATAGTKYVVVQVGKTERKLRPVSFTVNMYTSFDDGKTFEPNPSVIGRNLRRQAARDLVQRELEWDRLHVVGPTRYKYSVEPKYAAEVLA